MIDFEWHFNGLAICSKGNSLCFIVTGVGLQVIMCFRRNGKSTEVKGTSHQLYPVVLSCVK